MTDQDQPPRSQPEIAEMWRQQLYPHIEPELFHKYLADTTLSGWDNTRKEVEALAAILTVSTSQQPDAASGKDYKALYHELLYAVATKHPHETRHQTALRYITQAENRPVQACMADDASREAAKRMSVRGPRERDEARAEVGRLREIALRTIDIMMEQESSHLNDPGVLGAYSILREVLAEALAAGEPGEEQS